PTTSFFRLHLAVYSRRFLFFDHPASTSLYTLSLHDALPILTEPRDLLNGWQLPGKVDCSHGHGLIPSEAKLQSSQRMRRMTPGSSRSINYSTASEKRLS